MFARKGMFLTAAAFAVLLFSAEGLIAQKRITFRRGATSATVTGKIGGKGYLEYMIKGQAGQLMSIDITSGNNKVIVNAGSASGKNFNLDMTGGDHMLSIVNTAGTATTYRLRVSIK
jgi:hypothetical protein